MKRIISLLILCSMALSVLLSCAEQSAVDSVETTAPQTEGSTVSEEISDELPDKNYEGREFNFFCRTGSLYEFDVEEQMGEVVSDAVYARNRAVEDRFNVSINTIDMDGTWGNMQVYRNAITSSILAGDGLYDLIEGDTAIVDLLGNNYFYNLLELENIHTDKPWWAQASVNVLNIGGVLEFLSGDLSLKLWEGLCVVFFNKQLVSDYTLDSPYQLVRDGKWTIDTLQRISKDIYKDLNGNGTPDEGDLYGLITTNGNMVDNFVTSTGLELTVKDDDGFAVLGDIKGDKATSITSKVFDLLKNTNGVFVKDETQTKEVHEVMFMGNQGVFYTGLLDTAKSLRTMDTDFGIIPYPKYDEAQQDYKTFSKSGYSAFAIPSTVKDAEFSSIILEALCAESYKKVIPAYYDIALKSKYSRDDESAEMLDIIRRGFNYNFDTVVLDYTDWISLSLRNMLAGGTYDWVSRMEKAEVSIAKKLENLKTSIQERLS